MDPLALGLALSSAAVHAGWNLLARARGAASPLLRVPAVTTAIGIIPAILLQHWVAPFSGRVWFLLVLSGLFQAWYHAGLTFGYRTGDFTLVYPLARALPVLAIALVDVVRGRAPTPVAWLGMILVVLGCAVIPHTSLRTLRLAAYRNRALPWIVVTAGHGRLLHRWTSLRRNRFCSAPGAATYYLWQMAFTVLPLFVLLLVSCATPPGWKNGATAGCGRRWWRWASSPRTGSSFGPIR
ncbi:MAG: hypothetical protein R2838_18985 [Caldilineaceae bacterium]